MSKTEVEDLETIINKARYRFMHSDEALQAEKFQIMCSSASTLEDLQEIVKEVVSHTGPDKLIFASSVYKTMFNQYIGWAVPSDIVINTIYETFMEHKKQFPNARLVDLGAGTGIYCRLLQARGIDMKDLVALELVHSTHFKNPKYFFPMTLTNDKNYELHTDDVVLIAWGTSSVRDVLQSYVDRGGSCVIIQGECSDGCTFPADEFELNKEWDVRFLPQSLPSLASIYQETLSINKRLQRPNDST
jgi:hypothetical protein